MLVLVIVVKVSAVLLDGIDAERGGVNFFSAESIFGEIIGSSTGERFRSVIVGRDNVVPSAVWATERLGCLVLDCGQARQGRSRGHEAQQHSREAHLE